METKQTKVKYLIHKMIRSNIIFKNRYFWITNVEKVDWERFRRTKKAQFTHKIYQWLNFYSMTKFYSIFVFEEILENVRISWKTFRRKKNPADGMNNTLKKHTFEKIGNGKDFKIVLNVIPNWAPRCCIWLEFKSNGFFRDLKILF